MRKRLLLSVAGALYALLSVGGGITLVGLTDTEDLGPIAITLCGSIIGVTAGLILAFVAFFTYSGLKSWWDWVNRSW